MREGQTLLRQGWTFQFEDDAPQAVTLPHTWNATDTMHTDPSQHYRRGRGTYTYEFVPPAHAGGRRLWLRFGAVAQRGWVYFDDEQIAEHHGGYTAFTVEVPNRAGRLRVVADNTPNPNLIPSDMSDFFLYGGITRDVTLYTTGTTRIEQALFDIDTTVERATMHLRAQLDGPTDNLRLHVLLFEPGEETHALYEESYVLEHPGIHADLPDLTEPLLWHPNSPQLYKMVIRLQRGGERVDEIITEVGFRWFDFPEGGPFYLNGERLLLRGTHRHDDWAGHGGAVPRELVAREMEQIKAAGFNFIRLGHYPQDDVTLHLCDTLGLIVWEELPWCRGGVGGQVFKDHARTMLHEMIYQHYNHPSVVFWGLGNELDWESEHPSSSDEKVAAFLSELHDTTQELDPRRLTALRRFEQGAEIVDVYSPSIWSGWYRGRYEDYEQVLRQAIEDYPHLLHIEWGGDSHAGRHNDGPHIDVEVTSGYDHSEVPGTATSSEGFTRYSRDGDWSESYMMNLMAHHLEVQARLPQLAGTAQWVFKDFGTPLRPENPIPYVNQKGLVTRDGTPKDVYWVFRAFQSTEPVVCIESSSWPVRVSDGQTSQAVRVVTNCERVTLFVNAEAVETRTREQAPAQILTWEVPMPPGAYTIEAVGYNEEQSVARHEIMQTVIEGNCGPVEGMTVQRNKTPDGFYVSVQLVDGDDRPVTNDERRVQFSAQGGIKTLMGTMGGSALVTTANGRAYVQIAPDVDQIEINVEGLTKMEKRINDRSYPTAD